MARRCASTSDRMYNASFPGVAASGSIGLWLKPNFNSGDSAKHNFWVFAANNTTSVPGFQKFSDNNVYVGFEDPGQGDQRIVIADTGLFVSGTWAYWLFTWTAGAQVIYKNGVSVGTAGLVPVSTGGLTIGNYQIPAENSASDYAELAYWSGAVLSAGERTALLNGARSPSIQNAALLAGAYWPLLGAASPEPDQATVPHDLTVSGTSQVPHPPLFLSPEGTPEGHQTQPYPGHPRWHPTVLEPFFASAAPPPAAATASVFGFEGLQARTFPGHPRWFPEPVEAVWSPPVRGTVPTPVGPGRGKARPFLRRVPEPQAPDFKRRLSGFTEQVVNIANSLIAQGLLQQTGPSSWTIQGAARTEARPPAADDDVLDGIVPGNLWIDAATGSVYINVSNTTAAAVWKLVS